MTSNNKIELIIDGLPDKGGDTSLDVFVKQLASFEKILRILDKEVSGRNTTQFCITALSHNSPYKVGLHASPQQGEKDFSPQIIDRLASSLECIEENTSPSFSNDFLEIFHKFTKPIGDKVNAMTISVSGKNIHLNKNTTKKIASLLASADECLTSYEGILQKVDLHGDKRDFYIFPTTLPNKKIKCVFPEELKKEGLNGIEKKICVYGLAKYRAKDNIPFEIEVKKVEIYEPEETLLKFKDIKGISPNATDGLSSEDFIARIRDDWK